MSASLCVPQVSESVCHTLDAAFGPDGLGLLCVTGDQAGRPHLSAELICDALELGSSFLTLKSPGWSL